MLNRALPKVVSAFWDRLSSSLLVTTTTTVHFLLSFFLPLDSPHFYTFTVHTRHTPQWHTLSDNYYLVQPPQSQFLLLVVFSAILFSSVQSSPPLNEDYSGNPLRGRPLSTSLSHLLLTYQEPTNPLLEHFTRLWHIVPTFTPTNYLSTTTTTTTSTTSLLWYYYLLLLPSFIFRYHNHFQPSFLSSFLSCQSNPSLSPRNVTL